MLLNLREHFEFRVLQLHNPDGDMAVTMADADRPIAL